jgi:multidrug resistance efflux pump
MKLNRNLLLVGGAVVIIGLLWFALGRTGDDSSQIYAEAQRGPFEVIINTTGELQAKNSTQILGPRNARDVRVYNFNIQRIVPEGTVVQRGQFVAELDRSEANTRLQDAQLNVQQAESQFEQAQLDSSLTLSAARNSLENLEFQVEERQLAVEQSIYESPSVQRQAEIAYEQTKRQLQQERENYATRVRKEEARLRELETELIEEQNELQRIQQVIDEFTVYAPENGMVIYSRNGGTKVAEGSSVSAWNPVIAELPDFSVMESITYVNEVDIQKVRVNQLVEIGLDAIPEKALTGVVTTVANIGEQRQNSDSKVFEVVIEINESDSVLRPSMTTSNAITIEQIVDVVYVPLETVFEFNGLDVVYKKAGLGVERHQVWLGSMNENDVVVKAGVEEGDEMLMSIPVDTSGLKFVPLDEDVLEEIRAIEQAELQGQQEQQARQSQSRQGQGGMMRMDFQNMTPEQRDSLRKVFMNRGGAGQGGQGGSGQGRVQVQSNTSGS